MPAFNVERYFESAILSVLSQSYENIELIIVDDASFDDSLALAKAAERLDSRVRVFSMSTNRGAAACRNYAIHQSRGALIAFLDSDDTWEPTKIERQLEAMRTTGLPACACSYYMSFEGGRYSGRKSVFSVPSTIEYEDMLVRNYFSCSTLMVEKDVLGNDPFDSNVHHEDYAAWLALIMRAGRACGVSEPLATYRVHKNTRSSNKMRSAIGRWKVLSEYTSEPFWRRVSVFVQYALIGVAKYRAISLKVSK